MNKYLFLLLCVVALWMEPPVLKAQTNSETARQISKIKRDTLYISAEATDEKEDVALEIAKTLLKEAIMEFLAETGQAADATNVVVQNMEKTLSCVKMPRGEMLRVFLYVKKEDIIKLTGNVNLFPLNAVTQEDIKPKEKDQAAIQAETAGDEKETKMEVEPVLETMQEEATFVQPRTASADVTGENKYIKTLPLARQQVLTKLLNAATYNDAVNILENELSMRRVKNYGRSGECRNPNACYWLINTSGSNAFDIYSPLTNGVRINVKTDAVEQVNVNMSGIWFVM